MPVRGSTTQTEGPPIVIFQAALAQATAFYGRPDGGDLRRSSLASIQPEVL